MDIVIANVYPDDNRGSAGLTHASIDLVRRAFPDARISLISIPPLRSGYEGMYRHSLKVDAELELLPPLAPARGSVGTATQAFLVGTRRWGRLARGDSQTVERISKADLVVSRGGAILRERGSLQAAKALWLRLLPLRLAMHRRIPVALLGSHVDRFVQLAERRVVSQILRGADLVVPRDRTSAANARALGAVANRVISMPDTVLFLKPGPTSSASSLVERYGLEPRRFLVVSLSGRPRGGTVAERSSQALASACRELIRSGVIDRVVLPAQVGGGRADDRRHMEAFAAGLSTEDRIFVPDDLAPADLAAFYGLSIGVVGTRLHATILGLVGGVPSMPLVLTDSHRIPSVFDRIGAGEFLIWDEATDVDALRDRLTAAFTDENARLRVQALVASAREELDRLPGLLQDVVDHAAS